MSLLLLAAIATVTAPQPTTVHSVNLDHRGTAYQVDYRAHVETKTRTIGLAPSARTSTQQCVIAANVTIERVIGTGANAHALKTILPGSEKFTRNLPGNCNGRDDQIAKLVSDKAQAISAHAAQLAATDRQNTIAAIDSAHSFAAN